MDTNLTEEKIIVRDNTEAIDAAVALNVEEAAPKQRRNKAPTATTTGKADKYIWGTYIVLLIFSIMEQYSASSTGISEENVYKPLISHGIFLGAGFCIVFALQRVHYKWFKHFASALFWLSFIGVVYTTLFGVDVNEAKRAIPIGPFTIQPPEIMKLTMVLYLAKVLAKNQIPNDVKNSGLIHCLLVVTLTGGILWFNGLTNAVMVMAISLAMFIIGGVKGRKILLILGVYITFGGIIYSMKYAKEEHNEGNVAQTTEVKSGDRSDIHKGRLVQFIKGYDPNDKITDNNRQVMYSSFAQAHGGILGQIWAGTSRESSRLPLANSDYIFSIVVEDLGFVGGVLLLVIYMCFIGRAGYVAGNCRKAFPAFLITGCALMIVLQAVVHMAINVGGPVSGQPLPLISRGGTSILVMSAAIGIMLSVSRFAVTSGSKKDERREHNELPEDLRADNPTMFASKK